MSSQQSVCRTPASSPSRTRPTGLDSDGCGHDGGLGGESNRACGFNASSRSPAGDMPTSVLRICPRCRPTDRKVQPETAMWSNDSFYPPSHVDAAVWRHMTMGRPPCVEAAPSCGITAKTPVPSDYSAGTIDTIFGALTITLRGALPPRRSATASSAKCSSSAGSMSGLTSSLARTLPLICTTAVTVS